MRDMRSSAAVIRANSSAEASLFLDELNELLLGLLPIGVEGVDEEEEVSFFFFNAAGFSQVTSFVFLLE
jgi:hypothetical protein